MSNLLAQNKELKRLKKELERRKLEEAEDDDVQNEEAQARAVEDFEKVQAGLGAREGGITGDRIVGRRDGKVIVESGEGKAGGTKRKFEIDEDELRRLATSERDNIKRRMNDERNVKSELPSFWVPGETPDNKKADVKAAKLHPTCPAAELEKPHEFSLKTLVVVNFSEEKQQSKESTEESTTRSCPACNKALSNSTKAILAKPCGHVLCKPCSERFQKAKDKSAHDAEHDDTVRCYVCQEDITPGRRTRKKKEGEKEAKVERGFVELSCEGTGFAGGGRNMVKKDGLSFQC